MDTYLADAKSIYNDLKQQELKYSFKTMDPAKKLDYFQKKYRKFATSFPITLRYMVQLGLYHQEAFRKFIKKMMARPYRSEEEYCERQADYVRYLYTELGMTRDHKHAQAIWKETHDKLLEEVAIFREANEKVKKKTEKNNEINSIQRREELKKAIQDLANRNVRQ